MRRRAARRVAAGQLAVLLSVAAGLAACGGRGAALGTTSNACFHALPPAVASVHHRGRLIGVRLVDPAHLRSAAIRSALPPRQKVCLVAFSGGFTPSDVYQPIDQHSGQYVVVAVRPDGSRVLGSLIVRQLPLAFRHSHSL